MKPLARSRLSYQVPAGIAVSYEWRDPARVGPARRAELAAHDRRVALLNATAGQAAAPRPESQRQRDLAARQEQFNGLRAAGLSPEEAGEAMGGMSATTRRQYERRRIAGTSTDK